MIDVLARKLKMDPAELRMKNSSGRTSFPYKSALGWEYDSGDYLTALNKALAAVDYSSLRREQKANRQAFAKGDTRKLMESAWSFFTEIVGAGPIKNCDILGLGMFDSCEIRIHPTGAPSPGSHHQPGQGHATTFAQILASEIASQPTRSPSRRAIPTRRLRTWYLRVALDAGGGSGHRHGRPQDQAKAQMIAAYHLLEVHEGRSRMGCRPLPGEGQS